jgi:hypothetical protein
MPIKPRRLRATCNRYGGVMHMLAALDLVTGKIYYRIRQRKRRQEFLGPRPLTQRPRRTEDRLRPRLTHPSVDAISGQSGVTSGYATSRSTLIASITTAVAPWTP